MMFTFVGLIVITFLILTFLFASSFADNDTDLIAQKEHDLKVDFFATVDCNDPNAISGFVWNFSDTKSQAEQCSIYQTASKLLQLFGAMDNSQNHTMLPGNAYHSNGLHFPDDAYN